MTTLRFKFKRTAALRFLSHLDQQRLFVRAFRRGNLPLAYSQGFNPHPRLSFAQAMPVGLTSDSEYGEVVLSEELNPEDFKRRLNAALPAGLEISDAWEKEAGSTSLSASIESVCYEIILPKEGDESLESIQQALVTYLDKAELSMDKRNKKGKTVQINIRPFIKSLTVHESDEEAIAFDMTLNFIEQRAFKPELVLAHFRQSMDLDLPIDARARIHRREIKLQETPIF